MFLFYNFFFSTTIVHRWKGKNPEKINNNKKKNNIDLFVVYGFDAIELDIYKCRSLKDIDLIYHLNHGMVCFGSMSDYLVICFDAHGLVSSRDLINYSKVTFELLPLFK